MKVKSVWVCPQCETELKMTEPYERRLKLLGDLWDATKAYMPDKDNVFKAEAVFKVLDELAKPHTEEPRE